MRVALRAREVQVPDLTNRTANEATAIAADLGLGAEGGRRAAARSEDRARAACSRRSPPAGSDGAAPAQRQGLAERRAATRDRAAADRRNRADRAAAARAGRPRRWPTLSEIRSQDFAPDVVVAQDAAGEERRRRSVALLVNRGERGASYVMPDLIGVNGDRAADILRGRGFRVAVVGSNPYPGVAAGIVLRQSPQAGFQIAPGEPISLEVSR